MPNTDKDKLQTLKPSARIKIYHVGWLIALALYGPQTPCFHQWVLNSAPSWAMPGLPSFLPVDLLFRLYGWPRQIPESTSIIAAIGVTLLWAAGLFWLSRHKPIGFWIALVASAGLSSFFSFALLGALRA